MFIRVLYIDKTSGTVAGSQLEALLATGKIAAFRRSSGWVDVRHDPIRGTGGDYHSPERRKHVEAAAEPADFFG
jgi:hypothetical protein